MARSKNETRQTIDRDVNNPVPHLDSGYEADTSDDFEIPSATIEDCDVSLFNLFDKDIGFTDKSVASANKKVAIKKPFVIFATGERFAVAKKLRPPRDKNKALMLPAISIRRTSITQTQDDINGRGINQFTGTLTIKRKFNETSDEDYQNLLNKLALKNLNTNLNTRRQEKNSSKNNIDIVEGGLLSPQLGNNLWEIIVIPQPQYFTATYEVTFWTNYTQHMNYMIETYISSFLPQMRGHKLKTEKGYWFLAYTEDNFSGQENFEDFTEDSRVIRYSFNINVRSFILAPNTATNKVSVRKYFSSPNIAFESIPVGTTDKVFDRKQHEIEENKVKSNKDNKLVLTDLDRENNSTDTTLQKGFVAEKRIYNRKTGKYEIRTVSILEANQKKGETVFYASGTDDLDDFIKNLGQ